jgi:hypothetical protein
MTGTLRFLRDAPAHRTHDQLDIVLDDAKRGAGWLESLIDLRAGGPA